MSDDFLRLIPTTPSYVPEPANQAKAVESIRSIIPQAESVMTQTHETIEFIDQGSNFRSVACPSCKATLEISWWQAAMDSSFETEFTDLSVVTPCCSAPTSLNDLLYDMPAGFAKFVIEAMNPSCGKDLSQESIEQLQSILGCRIRQIWAHY